MARISSGPFLRVSSWRRWTYIRSVLGKSDDLNKILQRPTLIAQLHACQPALFVSLSLLWQKLNRASQIVYSRAILFQFAMSSPFGQVGFCISPVETECLLVVDDRRSNQIRLAPVRYDLRRLFCFEQCVSRQP